MLQGLDHVIVAVPDLDATDATLGAELGLEVAGGGEHPAFGTRNRLVWLGDSYLELVAVADADRAGGSWFGALVSDALAAEPGGACVGFAIATDDLVRDVAALDWRGPAFEGITDGERRRPDGQVVRWRSARPPGDPAPCLSFLIEHDPGSAEWTPAERAARAQRPHPAGGPVALTVLAVAVPDVSRAMQRLLGEYHLAFRPSLAGGGARDAEVGRQRLRLMPARYGAPGAVIGLRGGVSARRFERWGCRFELEPA